MNKLIAAILLVVGLILVFWGLSASNALNSEVSKVFTGAPTDSALWLLIGGAVLTLVGVVALFRGKRID